MPKDNKNELGMLIEVRHTEATNVACVISMLALSILALMSVFGGIIQFRVMEKLLLK